MPQTGKKGENMEKKRSKAKQTTASLRQPREPLRRLDQSALLGVVGAGRLRVPTGFADDGTPIYDDTIS